MSRERKPFTYTPGGLDLSEIKSERMAKRLMRNAMNQGVPQKPSQPAQSTTCANPVAIPNFNCLPVQVFPAFSLPANPKSLLRTRSHPCEPRDSPIQRVVPYQVNSPRNEPFKDNQSVPTYSSVNNNFYNNRPVSMHEYSSVPTTAPVLPRTSYGSDGHTPYVVPRLPEISYADEYMQIPPIVTPNVTEPKIDSVRCVSTLPVNTEVIKTDQTANISVNTNADFAQSIQDLSSQSEPIFERYEEIAAAEDEQREVKVIKKQVKKETKGETLSEDQNGSNNVEAELTVKLPTKKTAAKTETKVEILKKTLPDGSVQEIKTTTTKTTVDGKTEITTKTETTTIPKEEEDEEIEEEEDEEIEVQEVVATNSEKEAVEESKEIVTVSKEIPKENGLKESIIKNEERSEITSTVKKTVVVQQPEEEEDEEEEEVDEEEVEDSEEPVTFVVTKETQKLVEKTEKPPSPEPEEEEIVEEEEAVEEVEVVKTDEKIEENIVSDNKKDEDEIINVKEVAKEEETIVKNEEDAEDVEEEYQEAEDKEIKVEQQVGIKDEVKKEVEEGSEYTDEEVESEHEETVVSQETKTIPVEAPTVNDSKPTENEEKHDEIPQEKHEDIPKSTLPQPEPTVPLREPSIPLDKVEDVEIKPISAAQDFVAQSRTENTEITTSTEKTAGPLSTQTEYNRVENIVTVNRTTKTLDHSYEQLTQQGVPTVKTYFAPNREPVAISPTPAYQPVYVPEPQPERRHSLLLERLSTERQMPSEIYQKQYQLNNQTYEQQRQWSQEPQSEVVNVSNVKPSSITNQQWYQQNQKDTAIYNNVSTPVLWPPQSQTPAPPQVEPQVQPQVQTQSQYQPQPHYQPQSHIQYAPPVPQQTNFQQTYTDNISQDTSRINQSYQQNNYSSYTPQPSTWGSNNISSVDSVHNISSQSNQYSYLNKDTTSTENYQKTTQQYSASYVPPPWEQNSNYVADSNLNSTQNFYQAPPAANTFTPAPNQGWQPTPPQNKFTKPKSTSYIPPAPNQSFVKPVILEPPNHSGRKTYYSEYERRYITVPESTYIPSETKFQPQPDPSPQYYYDNNEPSEAVEHEWRKELREFTEKSQTQTEQTTVSPPWEEEQKYKTPTVTYTPTPSWSQTLRPQSWRERSFESEYVGTQDYSKTNTIGRNRPVSSYVQSNADAVIEKSRGVSVDRYNPNNYQSPVLAEHPPVQTHTLNAPIAPYHNPNVPAYHARASAEPRDQPAVYPKARNWGESRASPFQSRSFKYLQWITGTDD